MKNHGKQTHLRYYRSASAYQYKHHNGAWCCAVSSTNPCCFPFRHLFSSATFNPLLSPQYYFIIRLSHKLYAVKKTCAISED